MAHQGVAPPKVRSVLLTGVGDVTARARNTPQMMSRPALCKTLTPEMKVELSLVTSEVIVADFVYCGGGVARDVLLSKV